MITTFSQKIETGDIWQPWQTFGANVLRLMKLWQRRRRKVNLSHQFQVPEEKWSDSRLDQQKREMKRNSS